MRLDMRKRVMLFGRVTLLLVFAAYVLGSFAQGSAPEIVFIDFPKQIKADCTKVSGFVGFKDPDGDLARAEFTVVQAKDFQPFTVDLKYLKGTREGVFEFTLSTTTAQQVTLRVTLVDEAGNRSQPKEFSFEAVRLGQPPPQKPVLQVSPASLSFSATQGGVNPAPQSLTIANVGGSSLNWSATADASWLTLSLTQGTLAASAQVEVKVSVNVTGLSVGTHPARITVTAPEASNSPAIVSVTLTVSGGTPPPPPPGGTPFADRVVTFQPGAEAKREFSDPSKALGPPDWRNNPFYACGCVQLGIGGSLTLEFTDNEIRDGPGDDLRIYGDLANDEFVRVEVSADGVNYRSFGLTGEMASLDLATVGLSSAKFIRITDDGSREQSGGPSPGAEIDAVASLPAPGTPYADRVVSFQVGSYANRSFTYPADVLGPPDMTTDPPGGFVNLGVSGSITLEFWDNAVTDGPGDDIRIHGDPENDERIEVAVSQDGITYRSFGLTGEMASLDLAKVGLSSIRFIRIIDDGSQEQVGVKDYLPGAELDAVEALHSEPRWFHRR